LTVGITGHRKLEDPAAWKWVRRELTALLGAVAPLTGITSLAIGADQLFAEVVLELKGDIEAVIPFPDYERTFTDETDLTRYRLLKAASKRVEVLPDGANEDQAYLDAGRRVTDLSDLLVAVWDGQPARGLGGTADVVGYAARIGKRVVQFNPVTLGGPPRGGSEDIWPHRRT
jgi:hypothetical protein